MRAYEKIAASAKNVVSHLSRHAPSPYPQAFRDDTYIADLQRASKTSRTWTKLIVPAILLSVFADFYLLQDAFAWMLGTSSFSDLLSRGVSLSSLGESFSAISTMLVCLALIVIYLEIGSVAGKKLSEYRAFRKRSSLGACIFLFILEITVLVLIALVRYLSICDASGQSASSSFAGGGFGQGTGSASSGSSSGFGGGGFGSATDSGSSAPMLEWDFEAFMQTLGLVTAMVMGAFLGALHAYYTIDPYAAEKKRLAEAYIAEDRSLYRQVYGKYVISPERILELEGRERDLDRRAVACAFRVNELVAQLNGIVDPADAQDFRSISRIIDEKQISK